MNPLNTPVAFGLFVGREDGAQEARSLTSAVQARLRAEIIACRFRPGEKLAIATLSKRFQVSYALVREALSRLMADGLVVAEDQRGFRASPLSLADLRDLTQTRVEIEGLALRRSMARGNDAWRSFVDETWQSLDAAGRPATEMSESEHETWSTRHARFHSALVGVCGLDNLLRFRAVLYERTERYRRLAPLIRAKPRDVQAEHLAIRNAVLAGDADAASALMAAHLQRTADDIVRSCREHGWPDTLDSDPVSPRPEEMACST
ncbi:GntR family transcriptional regulator [Roseomonas sp. NAR14]|uniref:GntR family transcriptional regulator n=1 Tax=Roseomonas acroporae TaxID=2937791 RepID=A0A9X1YAZ0_9PROT|nr:GntR family transcriptional regulator [Roseomonas acroporae]MCK8786098.1 GntR family transcriptional regulator [Roseomonas acroporae]